MAEIITLSKAGRKKQVLIDFTPMVDLGFLLITFFILTTTMNQPKAMAIQMPYKPAPPSATKYYASSAVTVIPAANNFVYYYEGLLNDSTTFRHISLKNNNGLRDALLQKQKSIASRTNPDERELQVLIKPAASATFDDIVHTLDEMEILQVKQFAMVDLTEQEKTKIEGGVQ